LLAGLVAFFFGFVFGFGFGFGLVLVLVLVLVLASVPVSFSVSVWALVLPSDDLGWAVVQAAQVQLMGIPSEARRRPPRQNPSPGHPATD
jgi:hypothetical protein